MNALARALGLAGASVAQWRSVPPARIGEVARATGLSLAELRPDLQPGFAETREPFAEAEALGLDATAIAAEAVREAVRAEKARRWLEENREAIAAHSKWVEENGLPLSEYRII